MLRWPYSFRLVEGYKTLIPHTGWLRYIIDCKLENLYIKKAPLPSSGINRQPRKETVTVSLTSFPARINECYYAIKSLMIQSYQADRIILWLVTDQFADKKLPACFSELTQRGLEIRYCEDLRSHKKYYYALQEQIVNELVVTYDDDIIYEYDSIEKLVSAHEKYPAYIICNRGHEMTVAENKLQPYSFWKIGSAVGTNEPSFRIMPSTGNGCLYPYGCMPKETFDLSLSMSYAKTADDIWMKYNSMKNGVRIVKTRAKIGTLCNISDSQEVALTNLNDLQGENQKVIDTLNQHYFDASDFLSKNL